MHPSFLLPSALISFFFCNRSFCFSSFALCESITLATSLLSSVVSFPSILPSFCSSIFLFFPHSFWPSFLSVLLSLCPLVLPFNRLQKFLCWRNTFKHWREMAIRNECWLLFKKKLHILCTLLRWRLCFDVVILVICQMHNESCTMFPVSCINGCEQIIPRGQVRQCAIPEMNRSCPGAKINWDNQTGQAWMGFKPRMAIC